MKKKDIEVKSRRLYKILFELMKGSTMSSKELAAKFNVNVRTIERYIEELKMAGIPIVSSRGSHKLPHSMLDIDYDYTLQLSAREKKILLLMTEFALKYFGSLYSKELEEIKESIENSLKLDNFYSRYIEHTYCYLLLQPRVESIDIRVVDALEEAIIHNLIVKFNYRHPVKGWCEYEVEPYRLVFSDEHWYLFCKDTKRNFRLFLRLSRINPPVRSTQKTFSMPTSQQLSVMLNSVWGTHFSEREYEIKIWFSKKVAGRIEETIRHQSQKIEHNADGSIVCSFKTCGYRELISWVLSWGSQAKIISPDWIVKKISEEVEKTLGLYKNDNHMSI